MNARSFCMVLLIVLLSLSFAHSQASPSNTTRWAEGTPNATSEVKDGNKIEGLKTDDVHIFVSLADIKDTEYNRVWVQISNHGKAPINFDPQSAILINEKDKTVRAEAPDKAANSIQKFGEAKSQELSSAHCNNMIATGCQPTNAQMQVSKQVAAYSAQQAQWVRDNAIKSKTLAPGEEEQGVILFKKDKKRSDYILKVPIGTQILEFPVTAENKTPSYD
jgi:hypothetical protein